MRCNTYRYVRCSSLFSSYAPLMSHPDPTGGPDPGAGLVPLPTIRLCLIYKRSKYEYTGYRVNPFAMLLDGPFNEIEDNVAFPLLSQLFEMNGRQPLLPNLWLLQWLSSRRPARQLALRVLVGPRLTAFSSDGVETDGDREEVSAAAADTIASDLDTMRLAGAALTDICIDSAEARIKQFKTNRDELAHNLAHLRSAKLDYVLSDAMIPTLALLPRLEVLKVNLAWAPQEDYLSLQNAFPSLRTLLAQGVPSEVGELVRHVSSRRLSFIGLNLMMLGSSRQPNPHVAAAMRVWETLPQLPCADNLASLHLIHTSLRTRTRFGLLLQPLLSMHRLEHVHINLGVADVTDGDLRSIAAAWPLLRTLEVHAGSSPHFATDEPLQRPSLLTIIDLAIRRPDLDRLKVAAAKVSQVELEQMEDLARTTPPRTKSIVLEDAKCVDGGNQRLEAALLRLLPHARSLYRDRLRVSNSPVGGMRYVDRSSVAYIVY